MNVLVRSTPDGAYPYYFGKDRKEFPFSGVPEEMSLEDFRIALDYSYYLDPNQEIRLLGGEPTRHSRFSELVESVFSKGFPRIRIFSDGGIPEASIDVLKKYRDRISFSWTLHPDGHVPEAVLGELSGSDCSASFHVTSADFDTGFVLDFLSRHPEIGSLSIGISHPVANLAASNRNAAFVKDYPKVGGTIYDLVRKIVSNPEYSHVRSFGLHCGYVPCLWTAEQYAFLRDTGFSFPECSESLTDVPPDLSVRQCPTKNATEILPALSGFSHAKEAIDANARRFRLSAKYLPPADPKCAACPDRRRCFGGCHGERGLRARFEAAKLEISVRSLSFWRRGPEYLRLARLRAAAGDFAKAEANARSSRTWSLAALRLPTWIETEDFFDELRDATDYRPDENLSLSLDRLHAAMCKEAGKAVFDEALLNEYTATLVHACFDSKFSVRSGFSERLASMPGGKPQEWKLRRARQYLDVTHWNRYRIDDPWMLLGYVALVRFESGDARADAYLDEYFEKNPGKEDEMRALTLSLVSDGIIGDVTQDLLRKRFLP